MSFGRDDPDRKIQNDVPLEILPGTKEEKDHADEFALLDGLFSRTHARLEWDTKGVHLLDCRDGGINDATILDDQALHKKGDKLMFPYNSDSDSVRKVLFSKMLSIAFTPHYENIHREEMLNLVVS